MAQSRKKIVIQGVMSTAQLEELYLYAADHIKKRECFINPHYSISTLAQELVTNRCYLSKAINQFAGVNFRTWLAQFRVEYAKQVLLQNPDISMQELAFRSGFEERTNLYRQFRNLEGTTPAEWLEQQG